MYRHRSSLSVLGKRPETLPGQWLARYLVNGRETGFGKFTLQLVGAAKFWVEALGVVSVDTAVLARRVENAQPVDVASEFKGNERPWSFLRYTFAPIKTDLSMRRIVKWTAPSGEVLEVPGQVALRQGNSSRIAWTQMPVFEGKVQQPIGNWQVEYVLEGVVLAKLQFSLTP